MKRLTYAFVTLVAALFFLSQVTLAQDTTLVSQWGKTSLGTAWPLIPDTAGAVGIGDGSVPTGWSTVSGHFDTLTVTTTQAIVVTGQMTITGSSSGSAYTWLRYALAFQDSTTLNNAGTDTAMWTSPHKWYGYEFDPRTGAGTMANGGGGQGTVWAINNGNWTSTYSNGGPPLAAVKNQPYNAEAIAGTYNFAFSVESVNDTVNEVRWYLIEQNNKYWFGGTVQGVSTTKKFNQVNFGFNNDFGGTQVNFTGVRAQYGTPITVPEAPFQAFYADQWGKTSLGTNWPIIWNDSTTIVGNAGIGNGSVPTGWSTISAGFGSPIKISTTKAIIVTGKMQLVGGGGGSAYTWLRYALTYQDSATLNNRGTDSATWSSPKKWYGYEFDPRSGAGTMANGGGGQGTVWAINNGNWTSTYSNGGPHLAAIRNQPYNAEAVAGTYDFAISVESVNDTVNEVRWYLIEQNQKYWFGGTITGVSTTKMFNAINFGFNNDFAGTQVNFTDVKVDLGNPITVPLPPWQQFYVGDWGFYGGKYGNWTLTPDIVGNTTISGNSRYNPVNGWTVVRGGFPNGDVVWGRNSTDSTLVITGSVQFEGGGFEALNSFRFGLYNSTNAGSVDTTSFGADSSHWTGTDSGNYGYLFAPMSGNNALVNWSGISQQGSWGAVVNDSWMSTNGTDDYVLGVDRQQPAGEIGGAGTYDFTIAVIPNTDGTQIVKWKFANHAGGYDIEGGAVDNHKPLATSKFNGVVFGLGTGVTTTALKITNVLVDLGTPPNIATAIDSKNGSTLPTSYSLSQNFPNPFNPTTNIQFALPKSGNVSLVVYDILGREVATLVNENLTAGYHQVTFNASNLASGVYFYRITAGDFVSVKKLMLLK